MTQHYYSVGFDISMDGTSCDIRCIKCIQDGQTYSGFPLLRVSDRPYIRVLLYKELGIGLSGMLHEHKLYTRKIIMWLMSEISKIVDCTVIFGEKEWNWFRDLCDNDVTYQEPKLTRVTIVTISDANAEDVSQRLQKASSTVAKEFAHLPPTKIYDDSITRENSSAEKNAFYFFALNN